MTIEVWKLILGGTGAAFLTMLGAAVKYLREGAKAKEIDAKKQIKDWNESVVRRAKWEAAQHDWWRNWAGRLEYVITSKLGEAQLPKRRPYPAEPGTNEPEPRHAKESGSED